MADVFISYQHEDRAAAERVAQRLGTDGLSVWWDTSLVAGDAWTDTIRAELKAAKVVVVLWSNASWVSRWVQAEATAGHQRDCLVAARLDDVMLEPPFNIVQTADLRSGADGLDRLIDGIRRRTGSNVTQGATPHKAIVPLLAVLPFDNLSDDREMQFFSDGVSEEILYSLSRGSGLGIIGRTSAFQFRGANKKNAARDLKATHILDGTVRKSGSNMRVSAQLIEVSSGKGIWTERFDRSISEAFQLQDDIASKVAGALLSVLPARTQAAQVDPVAYELFLNARRFIREVDHDAARRAESLLLQVVARAPTFARAWAFLGAARAILLPRDRDATDEPLHDGALAAVQRALQLDPSNADAYATLCNLKPAFSSHAEKLQLMEKAVELVNNDTQILSTYCGALSTVGRMREALPRILQAASLEPMAPWSVGIAASNLSHVGRVEESIAMIEEARRRMPNAAWIWTFRWVILFSCGRIDEAAKMCAPGAPLPSGMAQDDANRFRFIHSLLQTPQSQREVVLSKFLDTTQSATLPLELCQIAARVGCADLAFEKLFEAFASDRPIGPMTEGRGVNRAFLPATFFTLMSAPLRQDIRFPRLCARMNLVDYWRTSGHWPDCASDVPYDFKAECEKAAAEARKL